MRRECRTRLARPNSQARTRTGKYQFSLLADHEQDWQPYPVDPSLAICDDHTYSAAGNGLANIMENHTFTRTLSQTASTQKEVRTAVSLCVASVLRVL